MGKNSARNSATGKDYENLWNRKKKNTKVVKIYESIHTRANEILGEFAQPKVKRFLPDFSDDYNAGVNHLMVILCRKKEQEFFFANMADDFEFEGEKGWLRIHLNRRWNFSCRHIHVSPYIRF